jgi:lipoyl(octanoyl) transferase
VAGLVWTWLGRVRYQAAWDRQEELRQDLCAGRGADTLLLCEHDPVVTLGRFADTAHVLAPARLAALGVEVVRSNRGGGVTYHGPGQLVGYPVVRLRRGVLGRVQALADAVADALAPLGVRAEFRRDAPGLWAGGAKLCAFGVHVRRGVAIHGFALNLRTDLAAFEWIVPCNSAAPATSPITSVERLLGSAPAPAELAPVVAAALARRLGDDERTCEPAA